MPFGACTMVIFFMLCLGFNFYLVDKCAAHQQRPYPLLKPNPHDLCSIITPSLKEGAIFHFDADVGDHFDHCFVDINLTLFHF